MLLRANRPNLKKYARQLLGNNYSPESEKRLIDCAINGFKRNSYHHVSFDRINHLNGLNSILGTYRVEGILLDKHGNDVSGECSMSNVAADIQYCNAGDTCAITILYYNGKLMVGDWGSIVEKLS